MQDRCEDSVHASTAGCGTEASGEQAPPYIASDVERVSFAAAELSLDHREIAPSSRTAGRSQRHHVAVKRARSSSAITLVLEGHGVAQTPSRRSTRE